MLHRFALAPALFGCGVFLFVAACAESEPRAPDAPLAPAPITSVTVASTQSSPPPLLMEVTPPPMPVATDTPRPACGPQPSYGPTPIEPTCSDVTLKSGQSWQQQLTLQLSSGATTRIDCPRMHFHGQDTPVCVARKISGRMRGACCPPGVSDPTDQSCVGEGTVDEMYKRQRVWDWCDKDKPQSRPCEPCVWVSGASR
jgi:hypothetical protein